jgi:hypothetical protein
VNKFQRVRLQEELQRDVKQNVPVVLPDFVHPDSPSKNSGMAGGLLRLNLSLEKLLTAAQQQDCDLKVINQQAPLLSMDLGAIARANRVHWATSYGPALDAVANLLLVGLWHLSANAVEGIHFYFVECVMGGMPLFGSFKSLLNKMHAQGTLPLPMQVSYKRRVCLSRPSQPMSRMRLRSFHFNRRRQSTGKPSFSARSRGMCWRRCRRTCGKSTA